MTSAAVVGFCHLKTLWHVHIAELRFLCCQPLFIVLKCVFLVSLFVNGQLTHLFSDSGINHQDRMWGERVFAADIIGLCLSSSVPYPLRSKVCLLCCKTTYTIYGIAPKASFLLLSFHFLTCHFFFSFFFFHNCSATLADTPSSLCSFQSWSQSDRHVLSV